MPDIIPRSLHDPDLRLETAGGKGLNLGRLKRAGFPVPEGFIIPVDAYAAFVAANDLNPKINQELGNVGSNDASGLDSTSQTIRKGFTQGVVPSDLAGGILNAYREMGSGAVAVRSSATAEDLPEASFAGQQDTFLNVIGEGALLEAVVKCWSSLWTARAISYRHRNSMDQANLGLAVVVQAMVPSQVSGVAFTANPLTGRRTEMVIDATLGLGEALVSGKVEPDHYVVDMHSRQIIQKQLGTKALVIEGQSGGGTLERVGEAGQVQSLPDAQILELADLCQRVAEAYDSPQDIEWAWAGGKLYLLQARPITTLFPTPVGVPYYPLRVMFSFAAVQGILDPLTPLGSDAIRLALNGLQILFGYQADYREPGLLQVAGMRLFLGFTALVKNSLGRKLVAGVLRFVEPSIGYHLKSVLEEPELQPQEGVSLNTRLHIIRAAFPVVSRTLMAIAFPDVRRQLSTQIANKTLAQAQKDAQVTGTNPYSRLAERVKFLRHITEYYLRVLPPYFIAPLAAGMASINLVNQLLKRFLGTTEGDLAGMQQVMMELTRGVPYNVTTEMDLFLWETAQKIRSDPDSTRFFMEKPPEEIAKAYIEEMLPPVAQKALDEFMELYGMRGVGEIDLGRPRWMEEPLQIVKVLISYLNITDVSLAPDAVFRKNAEEAELAIAAVEAQIAKTHGGWLKKRLYRFATGRVRSLIGLRESPKFFIIRVMGIMRKAFQESGNELAEADILDNPEDIFFLSVEELEALSRREDLDCKALVVQHRRNYEREKLRKQIPFILMSDGRAFYGGPVEASMEVKGSLIGNGVSPGMVEGKVRVVFSPQDTALQPGEILVCPGTDPAWTPLFLAAGGLVMEVGGMMTHGAVVAREYGIPAVVGVAQATSRLKTGQHVRVDGERGVVQVLLDGEYKNEGDKG
jgi:phosphohistidine swiveling domain-containing protein